MWSYIYKKLIIDFSKLTFLLIAITLVFSIYHTRNFNLDASSDALLLEGDEDLRYLRSGSPSINRVSDEASSLKFFEWYPKLIKAIIKKANISLGFLSIKFW